MRIALLVFASLFASSAWSIDLYTPAAPAADTDIDSRCGTRNERLNKASDATNLSDACKEQVKKSAEACAKDPEVSGDDLSEAHDAAAPGSPKASWESYKQIHLLKQQKYSQRSDLCRSEEDKIKDVCNQSVSDLRKQMEANPYDISGNSRRAMQVSGTVHGAKDAMKTLDLAANCDSANANIERDGAAQAQVQADHIAAGGEAPQGPGTERPDPQHYVNGSATQDDTSGSALGSTATKTAVEKAGIAGETAVVASQAEQILAPAARTVASGSPIAGGVYSALHNDPVGAAAGVGEGTLSVAGYTTAATVGAAGYAVYQGMWGFGGANMGANDTPWTQWNATNAANIAQP